MDNGIKIGFASFLATAALLAIPATSDAHPRQGGAMTRAAVEARVAERFAAMDADGDGAVTLQEAQAAREARRAVRRDRMFARLDADGDGAISAEERAAMRGHRRGGRPVMVEEADMRARARLTPEEMAPLTEAGGEGAMVAPPAGAERRTVRTDRGTALWAAADSDGDGALSRAEFEAAAAARSERRQARRADRFATADADGDGSLSLAEMQARALARFDAADADNDGAVTRAERRAARQARRAERRRTR